MGKVDVSICVPVFNEEENIRPMYAALTEAMRNCEKNYTYEIIFRDNASADNTVSVLREIAANDQRVKVIVNARNYGLEESKDTARRRISGDALIMISGDLQEPPELIPEFLKWYERGYEAVCGQKIKSAEGKFKYSLRQVFYSVIDFLSEVPQYRNLSGIYLFSRRVNDLLLAIDETDRFSLAELGCDIKIIPYEQRKRQHGKSSYNIWRYLTFSIDSLIATSTKPLRIATLLGLGMSAFSFLIGVFYLIRKLILWDMFTAGTAPVLIGMFFLGSVQLFFIGLLGEYVGTILKKVRPPRPPIVQELINFENEDDPYLIRHVGLDRVKKTEKSQ